MPSLLAQAGLDSPQTPLETLRLEDCVDLVGQVLTSHTRHPALRSRYPKRLTYQQCNEPFLLLLAYGTSVRHCGPSEWLKQQLHQRLAALQARDRLGISALTAVYENTAWPGTLFGYIAAKQAQDNPILPHLVVVDHEGHIDHVPRAAITSAGFDDHLGLVLDGLAKSYRGYLAARGIVPDVPVSPRVAAALPTQPAVPLQSPATGNPLTVLDQVMADEYGLCFVREPGRNAWFRLFINQRRTYLVGLLDDRTQGRSIPALALLAYGPGEEPVVVTNDRPTPYYADFLGRFIATAQERGVPKDHFLPLGEGDRARRAVADLRAVLERLTGRRLQLPGELPGDLEVYFQGDAESDRTGYWARAIGYGPRATAEGA